MSEREPSGDGRPAAGTEDAQGEAPILELRNVSTSYGPVRVLEDVTMEVRAGEVVCLLGSNAAGKTTTLRTILGLVRPNKGEVVFSGERIDGLSTPDIVAKGITMVPENRRLFGRMSVRENLEIGAHMREDKEGIQRDVDRVLTLFPRLKERLGQKAGTLSGGEQQMLAIGRALTANPRVLLMDEPSMGLAPILVEQVFSTIKEINEQGTTIFVVEQNANMALSIADRGYVLQTGQIVLSDSAKALLEDPRTREAYLGELSMTLVVLDGDQLRERLSMKDAIDALEETFGADELPRAPVRTHLAVPGGDLMLMPAVGEAGLGVKLVTIAPANPARGLPLVQAAYVLFAPDSLELVAHIDGAALTALRTAAVSGLATRHLARRDSSHLVLFGAGVQASSHLEAMVAVRPIRKVTVVSRTPEPAERLVARARAMGLLGEVGRPPDVAAADVICTCTTSSEPVFDGSLLSPGTHVNAIGAFRPDARELDERTVTSGRVVVEIREAAFAEAGDLLIPAGTGAFRTSDVVADLGEVVRGARVRRNPRDITVFKSVGVAFEDLCLALAALGGASESDGNAEPLG